MESIVAVVVAVAVVPCARVTINQSASSKTLDINRLERALVVVSMF
jgi:hypothetical protein